jgi:hypothetical protein
MNGLLIGHQTFSVKMKNRSDILLHEIKMKFTHYMNIVSLLDSKLTTNSLLYTR